MSILPTLGLIGAGAVGSALAQALARAGFSFSVILGRSAGLVKKLAQEVVAPRAGSDYALIGKDTRFLLIAVPDDQIAAVDRLLGKRLPNLDLAGVMHTSGVLPGSALETLSQAGVPVGSIHPLQTFPAKGPNPDLKGVYFAIEGDERLLPVLNDMAFGIGGTPITISSQGKAAYHAAAVFASNFIPVLLREARELLFAAGVPDSQVRPMLAPLMRASLENCLKSGESEALTGPVARGDAATIRLHLEALKDVGAGTLAIYQMLSLKALELALEKGLSEEAADRVQSELTR
jgi:predicted short-subunit dehydrogenase-like oxidoreductase (DUF2520 family)